MKNYGLRIDRFFSYDFNTKLVCGYYFKIKIKNFILAFCNDGGYYPSEYKFISNSNQKALILGRFSLAYFNTKKSLYISTEAF